MTNTGNNINQAAGQAPEALSRAEKLRESAVGSILESSRVRFTAILAALGLSASVAVAEEATSDRAALLAAVDAPVAETVTDGSYRVAAMLPQEEQAAAIAEETVANAETTEVIDDSAWLNNLDLSNENIANFLLPRVEDASFEYVRNHLRDFGMLSHEMQAYIVDADAGIGGHTDEQGNIVDPLLPEEMLLLGNLRVPTELRTAILEQIATDGNISEEQIAEIAPLIEAVRLRRSAVRGMDESLLVYLRMARTLDELANDGDLPEIAFDFIEEHAGELYHAIPKVVELELATQRAEVAVARAEASEESANRQAERTQLARLVVDAINELNERVIN